MTFFYDLNKKLKEVAEAPKSVHQNLNEGKAAVAEVFPDPATIAGSLALGGALGAVKGRYDDLKHRERGATAYTPASEIDKPRTTMQRLRAAAGVPSKNDPNVQKADEGIIGNIGQSLGKGIKKAGKAVGKALVGPSDQELAADLQDRMYPDLKKVGKAAMEPPAKPLPMAKPRTPIAKEEYGPLEEKGGAPMTAKQKKFAKLAPPADKITFADKIAGAKQEVDEMLGDVAAEAMKSALRGGQKKLDKNHNGKIDGQDLAMLRAGKGKKQETDEGWDDMMKSVEKRHGQMKKGEKVAGHKGEIEKTDKGIKHTRRYDDKTGETDTGDDDTPKGEKRRGRPKGTGKAMGAKGPSGKSKLMTKEAANPNTAKTVTDELAELRAIAKQAQTGQGQFPQGFASRLESALWMAMQFISKAQGQPGSGPYTNAQESKELDEKEMGFAKTEKAVAKNPKVKNPAAVAAKIGREKYGQKEMTRRSVAGRKDESEEVEERHLTSKEKSEKERVFKKDMKPQMAQFKKRYGEKDGEGVAHAVATNIAKGVKMGKKKKEESVEETATETPKAPKGGMQFGKGIYDSMNRELEQMIAESMNVSMNMSDGENGGPAKSITVTATDDDALALGKLLQMAGLGGHGHEHGGESCPTCGESPCGCAEQVAENQPDWPTEPETNDDALQYAGGLNKPKTTVAGDGQTTVPVTAVQVREEAEEELDEQEQVMAVEEGKACDACNESPCKCESVEESLARFRSLAGIQEAAKPDYVDLDKDGNKKESMKKAAADAEKDKKVEESILNMTNLWKAYKG